MADASGAKYSAGSAPPPVAANTKPPVASKPAFTPTHSSRSGVSLPSRGRNPQQSGPVDEDGWGTDAPPVVRTQLEKVASAYQPTKVNLADLKANASPSGSFQPSRSESSDPDVVRGGYQPIGKVDIAEIRRQAKESGALKDERPGTVKGSYEPIGKVDIAAIRAKAQKPADAPTPSFAQSESSEAPKSLADRSSSFQQSERLAALPKPKVANKFGGSSFTGTTAPTPGAYGAKPPAGAAPVGTASRTFADQGGKTPAQIWAEKKARERGTGVTSPGLPAATSPVTSQPSGGGQWESGYSGKKWGSVQTSHTGKSMEQQRTGSHQEAEEEAPQSSTPGFGNLKDRFSGAAPMGAPAPSSSFDRAAPAPVESTKPNRGVAIPGLVKPPEPEAPSLPTPPPQPRSPSPPTPDEMRDSSPVRIAMPVGRGAATEEVTDVHEEQQSPPPPMPMRSLEQAAEHEQEADDRAELEPDYGRTAATTAAVAAMGEEAVNSAPPAAAGKGKTAIVEYDYDAAESNEISLKEGEHVTDIDMVDTDWWLGTNSQGQSGLFPSNYVTVADDDDTAGHDGIDEPHEATGVAAAAPATGGKPTATSLYDYEAAESNEISFPEGATITNLVSPPSHNPNLFKHSNQVLTTSFRNSPTRTGG